MAGRIPIGLMAKARLHRLKAAKSAGTFPTAEGDLSMAKKSPTMKTKIKTSADDLKQVKARQRYESIPEGNVRRRGRKIQPDETWD